MHRYRLALVREEATQPFGVRVARPADLARIATALLCDEPQELVLSLHLDARRRLRGYQEVARGGLEEAPVDLRVLFAGVLATASPAFCLAHNHPSGSTEPSNADLALTERVRAAARLLGLELVDHLVVGGRSWTSLRTLGGW